MDANDNVYAFNRGEHPMIVFDKGRQLPPLLGRGHLPPRPRHYHGPRDTIFCTDDGDHTVRKCKLDGTVLFTLGISGTPAPS